MVRHQSLGGNWQPRHLTRLFVDTFAAADLQVLDLMTFVLEKFKNYFLIPPLFISTQVVVLSLLFLQNIAIKNKIKERKACIFSLFV